MLPDWISNPGPLTYESGVLPRGPPVAIPAISHDEMCHADRAMVLLRSSVFHCSKIRYKGVEHLLNIFLLQFTFVLILCCHSQIVG